jgi:hypothetical protein
MSTFKKFIAIGTVGSLSLLGAGVASAASSGVPSAPATHSAPVVPAAAHLVKKVAFKATYKGTMTLLWSESSVSATSLKGKGTATLLGVSALTGSGSAPFSGQDYCEPLTGKGVMSGAGSKIMVSVTPSTSPLAQACAPSGTTAAPAPVTIQKGVLKVTGGTGKYKGVSGTLTYTATFLVTATTGTQSPTFTATVKGTLTVKS